jgi:hypothetical protein
MKYFVHYCNYSLFFLILAICLLVLGVLYLITISDSHTHAHTRMHTQTRSVGLNWRSNRPMHIKTDTHAPGGIRTRNPSKRAATDLRFQTERSPGSTVFCGHNVLFPSFSTLRVSLIFHYFINKRIYELMVFQVNFRHVFVCNAVKARNKINVTKTRDVQIARQLM